MRFSIWSSRAMRLVLAALLAGAAACTVQNPNFVPGSGGATDGSAAADRGAGSSDRGTTTPPGECDILMPSCLTCTPGVTVAICDGRLSISCGSDGRPVRQLCSGTCKDGRCQGGCTKVAFYRDADGDGHGDPDRSQQACTAPPGFVQSRDDCDDDDNLVFPGQTRFFEERSKNNDDFDYNCDNREEARSSTMMAKCTQNACTSEGWIGFVPDCGAEGTYGRCTKPPQGGCTPSTTTVVQACR
ncbi:MAG: hypothetical protein IT371_12140 [Deltaproteobacteria bacterium]|nr:hypothetical protein [Deltaproteobacteria bacterium]